MRLRTIVVSGALLALAGVLTGCGAGNSAAGGATSSAVAPASSGVPTAPTSTSTVVGAVDAAGTGGTAGGSSSTSATSFTADLTIQQAGLGLLAVTNSGKHTVTIQGWPSLTFLNEANEPVSVPLRKVSVPGAGPAISLAPGRTVFAGVKWVTGDKGDPKTAVATSISLTPPGSSKAINVNLIGTNGKSGGYIEFDMTSVEVGTLQPATQGVLVF